MIRPACLRYLTCLIGTLALIGCSSVRTGANQNLDEFTGASYMTISSPDVFFRSEPGRAAYARDYLQVAPLMVNRMGNHQYYLWLGIWSTMADAKGQDESAAFADLVVLVDGEPMQLSASAWHARGVGLSESPFRRPVAGALSGYFAVTPDQIRMIYAANDVTLHAAGDSRRPYVRWRENHSRADVLAVLGELRAATGNPN